jgi:hypothetical protein
MSVKTTGLEFKKFYFDEDFWPKGAYHDELEIVIDGKQYTSNDVDSVDFSTLADNDSITIIDGVVLSEDDSTSVGFVTFFKRWRKQCNNKYITLECDASAYEELKAALAVVIKSHKAKMIG